jgi:hypothetical protein
MKVLNTTSLSIDALRHQGELFMEELSREYYLAHSGQKPTAELQPIYRKYGMILGPDALAMVLEFFRSARAGSEEQRGLRLLTDWHRLGGGRHCSSSRRTRVGVPARRDRAREYL